jgi:uncharacterized membrane protein YhaH (DUF805 family)
MEWVLMPLKRYAEFSGRSRRKEYWLYVLGICAVSMVLGVIEGAAGINKMVLGVYGPLTALLLVGTIIPSLAVGVRRLHDTDRTGWWIVLPLVPEAACFYFLSQGDLPKVLIFGLITLVLALVLLAFLVMDGTKGPNKYGPDPKGAETEKVFA